MTILDNFNDYYDPTRKRTNVEEVRRHKPSHAELELVEGDLRDRELVSRLVIRAVAAACGAGPVELALAEGDTLVEG